MRPGAVIDEKPDSTPSIRFSVTSGPLRGEGGEEGAGGAASGVSA
jgi:hypothetical protein